jgi:biopolymer transport protein ExbD
MRLRKGGRPKHTPEMNMTPMIDVVFQLLIFFMVGMQVSKINAERLELPQLAGLEEQKEQDLTINVNQGEQIMIGGKEHTHDAAIALVAETHAKAASERPPTALTIVLRIDRRSTCKPVNDLVNDLSRMEIKRIRFAVQVPEK